MATILVLAHEHDRFHARHFMLQGLFPYWLEAGHVVAVHEGTRGLPAADIAILHVDLTVVPREYLEALERYPVVLNLATRSVAKRSFSEHLVRRGDGFEGPVIVKTDLNSSGLAEAFHAQEDARLGRGTGAPAVFLRGRYPVLASPLLVSAEVWSNPDLVVEKFLPEKDEQNYALRTYIFFGDRERCSRVVGPHPVVKASDTIERVVAPIPDELRSWRRRLGFDYGKFDFALHEGRPVLYDVNRTPTIPGNLSEAVQAGMKHLAAGIDAFLRR